MIPLGNKDFFAALLGALAMALASGIIFTKLTLAWIIVATLALFFMILTIGIPAYLIITKKIKSDWKAAALAGFLTITVLLIIFWWRPSLEPQSYKEIMVPILTMVLLGGFGSLVGITIIAVRKLLNKKMVFFDKNIFIAMLAGIAAATFCSMIVSSLQHFDLSNIFFGLVYTVICLFNACIGLMIYAFLPKKIKIKWITPTIIGFFIGILPEIALVLDAQIKDFTLNFDSLFKDDGLLIYMPGYELNTTVSWRSFIKGILMFGGYGIVQAVTTWAVWMRLKGYPFKQKPDTAT